MIAQRERRIGLVSEATPGIHRPSGDHPHARTTQPFPQGLQRRTRGCHHHVSPRLRHLKQPELREHMAQLRIHPRHLRHRFAHHDRQPHSRQACQDLLRLPQRIPQQDRNPALLQRLPTELVDPRDDLRRGREHILRAAEGRLHYQRVRPARLAHLRRQPRPQLEVARVQQRTLRPFQQRHRRTQDVPRRQQRQRAFRQCPAFPEFQRVLRPLASDPRPHQAPRRLRQVHLRMTRRVIRMRMTHEHRLPAPDRLMRVQPHPPSRQMQRTLHVLKPGTTHRRILASSPLKQESRILNLHPTWTSRIFPGRRLPRSHATRRS